MFDARLYRQGYLCAVAQCDAPRAILGIVYTTTTQFLFSPDNVDDNDLGWMRMWAMSYGAHTLILHGQPDAHALAASQPRTAR